MIILILLCVVHGAVQIGGALLALYNVWMHKKYWWEYNPIIRWMLRIKNPARRATVFLAYKIIMAGTVIYCVIGLWNYNILWCLFFYVLWTGFLAYCFWHDWTKFKISD